MKVSERRSDHWHACGEEEGGVLGRNKKKGDAKVEEIEGNEVKKMRMTAEEGGDFEEFCKVSIEHLSVDEMHSILEINGQDSSGTYQTVVRKCFTLVLIVVPPGLPSSTGQLTKLPFVVLVNWDGSIRESPLTIQMEVFRMDERGYT